MPEERDNNVAEWLVKALGALGFNEVKLRWRFRRWANSWERSRNRAEQRALQRNYRHTACPNCRAINDRDARVCASCKQRLPSRAFVVLERLGLTAPQLVSMSTLLGIGIVLVYVRLVLAAGGGEGIVSIPVPVLIEYGGNFPPAVRAGEWWRLGTSIFSHAGLWHIGFNLFALSVVGPQIEQLYGRLTMIALFMITGLAASTGSMLVGPDIVSIGASGAIMGLIGIAAGWGHRDGTTIGRQVRNDMIKWALYVMVFGFLVGADNAAHFVGFVSGFAIALVVSPRAANTRQTRPAWMLAGTAALIAATASVFLAIFPPQSEQWGARDEDQIVVPEDIREEWYRVACGRRIDPSEVPSDEERQLIYRQCKLIEDSRGE